MSWRSRRAIPGTRRRRQQRGPRPTAGGPARLQDADHAALVRRRRPLLVSQRPGRRREGIHPGRRRARDAASPPSTSRSSPRPSRRPPGQTYKADRLPFDEIDFVDDAKAILFQVGDTTWKCHLDSYECSKVKDGATAPPPSSRRRGSAPRRLGPAAARGDAIAPASGGAPLARRQVDRLRQGPQRLRPRRREGRGESAQHGRQGGPRLRPALVVARLEDAGRLPDRAGRAQGGLPHPVIAARRRPGQAPVTPLPAARRQVHRLRAEPLRRRRQASRSSPRSIGSTSARHGSTGTRTAGTSPTRRSTAAISGSA